MINENKEEMRKLISELDLIRCNLINSGIKGVKNEFDDSLMERLSDLSEFDLKYVAECVVGRRGMSEFIAIIKNWDN